MAEKVDWRFRGCPRRQRGTGILLRAIPIHPDPLQRRRKRLEGRRAKESKHGDSKRDNTNQSSELGHVDHNGFLPLDLILTL